MDTKIAGELSRLRMEYRYNPMKKAQWTYLRNYWKKNKQYIGGFIVLSFVEAILTVLLVLVLESVISKYLEFLPLGQLIVAVGIMTAIVAAYLVLSFWIFRLGQKIVFRLYVKVRHDWFRRILDRKLMARPNTGSKVFTKILYHAQLLKMGLENVLLEGAKGVLLYIALLIVAAVYHQNALIMLVLALPLLVLVFYFASLIGRFFISREQTYNMRILNHLYKNTVNRKYVQAMNLEVDRNSEMKTYLDLDAHFRMRREMWFKMSNRIIWAVFIILGFLAYLIQSAYPIFSFQSWNDLLLTGILFAFFSKLIYHMVQAGLYFEPFFLGIKIATPDFSVQKMRKQQKAFQLGNKKLLLKGKRVKISRFGKVIRNFKVEIGANGKVVICGNESSGKSTLAQYIVGQKEINSLNVYIGGHQYGSHTWAAKSIKRYLATIQRLNNVTLIEFLTGKSESKIDAPDFAGLFGKLSKYPYLKPLLLNKNLFARKVFVENFSDYEWFLVNLAHLLVNKYEIIVFDHTLVDQVTTAQNLDWETMINDLGPSRVIIFTENSKFKLNNAKQYQLTTDNLEEI